MSALELPEHEDVGLFEFVFCRTPVGFANMINYLGKTPIADVFNQILRINRR